MYLADVRLQSLMMWTVSPLVILLVMLLICLCFLCYRCFRRERAKKHPVPCVHWSIYLLALISWYSLADIYMHVILCEFVWTRGKVNRV